MYELRHLRLSITRGAPSAERCDAALLLVRLEARGAGRKRTLAPDWTRAARLTQVLDRPSSQVGQEA